MSWTKDERRLADLMDTDLKDTEYESGGDRADGTPPPELIDRIVAEIPEQLPAPAFEAAEGEIVSLDRRADAGGASRWTRRIWTRLAASLAVLVLGGFLASQLWRQPPEIAPVSPPPISPPATSPASPAQGAGAASDAFHATLRGAIEQVQASGESSRERANRQAGAPATPAGPVDTVERIDLGARGLRAAGAKGDGADDGAASRRGPESPAIAGKPAPPPPAPPPSAPSLSPQPVSLPSSAPSPEPESAPVAVEHETIVVSGELPSVLASSEISTTYDFDRIKRLPVAGASPGVPVPARIPPSTAPPSTGGTREPNDAPYGDVFFEHAGVNPFIDTEDDALSTFGLDVDTASYTVLRSYLDRGHLPPPEAVRVEEVLNYFDFDLPAPEAGADFALQLDGGRTPFVQGDRYRLLRIGLRGRDVERSARGPAVLVFVIDTSGSMARENRLEMVKLALLLLVDQLEPRDLVGIVTYGDRGEVRLAPTGDREELKLAILGLRPNGSTNAAEGLMLGYQMASSVAPAGSFRRVILCSDGVANVGATGPDSMLEMISRLPAMRQIELTTVGVGMGNYNDVLLEQLADRGNGRYAYVDSLAEAERLFVEQLSGTLQTIAAEAKVQVAFDPEAVERYRLIGYENRDIADRDFRNDRVDAGEIGAGHTVTALYEIKLRRHFPPRRHLGTVRLRYRPTEADGGEAAFVEIEEPITRRHVTKRWSSMAPPARQAALVAEFAEILRQSFWAKGSTLEALAAEVDAVAPHFEADERYAELRRLVRRAAELESPAAGRE